MVCIESEEYFTLLAQDCYRLDSNSVLIVQAHLDIRGNAPPDISLSALAAPVSSNETRALVKGIYSPSV